MRNGMLTWKSELWRLNCFIRWTKLQLNLQDMLCEYPHIKSESLAQIHITVAEIEKLL